ncbi:uncharacterized protein ASCRUDRAFT_143818 [Ascoidea rubescens DSM 1968]|uniref:Secreted protein n=1 Tax=Ascoidea rubescens DSM 1968 TaxID=1344418 RepID=A0A1D2VJ30_9ASCO|nr:hypothetical protein ASCRUDRAFT_143818 [Ascoidea rubescens DSM 1968]ODV61629.1 hypothetical protein ASCRUDRAFT_143818 [Ascoidea rubescens DSM 1968]
MLFFAYFFLLLSLSAPPATSSLPNNTPLLYTYGLDASSAILNSQSSILLCFHPSCFPFSLSIFCFLFFSPTLFSSNLNYIHSF